MESKEVAKRVYCHNGPRNGLLFRHGFLEEFFQGFPVPTTVGTEIGEQLSVPRSGRGQAPRKYRRRILVNTPSSKKTEDEMSVRNGLEHFFTEPLPEFHYTLLMTSPPWRD